MLVMYLQDTMEVVSSDAFCSQSRHSGSGNVEWSLYTSSFALGCSYASGCEFGLISRRFDWSY